ncbi:glycosyltransferase [Streptomyces sp. TRM66268-LWL]|uniref:D-inositol 3-phosphate glycosyltransferase n=1 Tax=Streptomyces polyasparticus TaxID=2767826 RepID=A0ABR7SYX4_9ACTN|nr:glycosyltransferase [Streptomyces polyasparticus]MBC9719563.1 glycosyltransferase [Streptomyces polyasparticus]
MKIAFLIDNAYGIGGTIRATANLSRALSVRHDVQVVSVHRTQDKPRISFGAGVELRGLVDMRADAATYDGNHALTMQPSSIPLDRAKKDGRLAHTALQDRRIQAFLRETDADVVIATRPILNGYLAEYGQQRYLRIGQEHLSLMGHHEQVRTNQNLALARLDAFVTVSESDAADYRAELPDVATTIMCIPNCVPVPEVEQSPLDSKLIIAAGRLVPVKRYDRLVSAFAELADEFPQWNLRLYGRGRQRAALREQIDKLGLYDRATLMGAVAPMETEWAKGAIAAVSSDMEAFGMTIVEAMYCGVPVIATDCPHGPGAIITSGKNGVLVPLAGRANEPDTIASYANALRTLMLNHELRAQMGVAAKERAAAFAPDAIARRYEHLIAELLRKRNLPVADSPQAPACVSVALLARVRRALSGAILPYSRFSKATRLQRRPTAHARVTPNGDIAVLLDAHHLPRVPLDFVLRLRHDRDGLEHRIPVPSLSSSPDRDIEVVLKRSELELQEGRWDTYIALRGTHKRVRLVCKLSEQAALLTMPLAGTGGEAGVSAWIPYTSVDGFFCVRTWLRTAHAEVDTMRVDDTSVTVRATLHGVSYELPQSARVLAVSRKATKYSFGIPLRSLGAGRFEFTIDYVQAMNHRSDGDDVWDLKLTPGGDANPVAIGRIGGDIVDRKRTDVVPELLLNDPERGIAQIKPYFTVTNDLAFSARETTPAAAAGA